MMPIFQHQITKACLKNLRQIKPLCSKSTEQQMTKFRKGNQNKYLQYNGYTIKAQDKDESIPLANCIEATDTNNNGVSYNSENYPWPKGTICITGN